jgi:hypothetical protein
MVEKFAWIKRQNQPLRNFQGLRDKINIDLNFKRLRGKINY